MKKQLFVKGYGCTDIGLNRLVNEDYFRLNDYLFVIADGMGGHNAGEVASKITANTIFKEINAYSEKNPIKNENKNRIQKLIIDTVNKVNEIVIEKSTQNKNYDGMGTTIVLALFQRPNIMHIANVGDSRAYLFRDNSLKILTRDHSVTNKMVRDGIISQNEAENHQYRHYLTQSIGTSKTLKTHIKSLNILPEDKFLLCSDGLWNILSNNELIPLLKNQKITNKTCENFIKQAKKKGSQDNISAICIKVEEIYL